MFAQLFTTSEEGNVYPATDRVYIDNSLEGLLSIPSDYKDSEAFWMYFDQSQLQADLAGNWHLVDNNIPC